MKKTRKISLYILYIVLLSVIVPVHAGPATIAGNPGPVLLWSATTGSTEIMSDNAARVSCSGDGKYVAAGYGAGIVEFRDRDGTVLWRWQSPHSYYTVWKLAVSRNGEYTGVVLYDPLQNLMGEFDYFDRAGNLLWSKPLKGPFGFESLSGNGSIVALSDQDRIIFFDVSGNIQGTTVLEGFPWTMAISDDGSTAAAGITTKDCSGNLHVLGTNGTVLWSSSSRHRSESVAISHSGKYLASADLNQLRYFTAGGDRLWGFNSTPEFTGVAVSSDGAYVAASSQYYLRYFNASGSKLWQYEAPTLPTKPGPYLSHLSMSDDGGYISVTTDGNRTLFFDRNGDLLWQNANPYRVKSTSLSRNGKYLAIGTEQEFSYFNTGIDAPVAEPDLTTVATTITRGPAPTSTPKAAVPVALAIGSVCIGILMHTVYRKK